MTTIAASTNTNAPEMAYMTSGGRGRSALTNLFGVDRPAVAAFVFAVTAIIGAVCVAGGVYLLHRQDAHAYFTR